MEQINKLVRKNIKDLLAYSCARDEYTGKQGTFLDANESPYGDFNRYPDPQQQRLKSLWADEREIDANQVFVGNGSDEVIDLLFRVFCEPGKDKVIAFTPGYGMYRVSAAINNVELIELPLGDDFELLVDDVLPFFTDPAIKLMFVCSPNNPTGNSMDAEVLEDLVQCFQGLVVVDEAYIDFCPEKTKTSWLDKYPNLVITQTMSKAWGLAAARIGFALSSPSIVGLLNKVKPPYNVSTLNQEQAIQTLLDKKQVVHNVQQILDARAALVKQLEALDVVLQIFPSDTNFLLVRFKDAEAIYQALISKSVIVRNRNNLVSGCLRISIGTKLEQEKLITVLKRIRNEEGIIY